RHEADRHVGVGPRVTGQGVRYQALLQRFQGRPMARRPRGAPAACGEEAPKEGQHRVTPFRAKRIPRRVAWRAPRQQESAIARVSLGTSAGFLPSVRELRAQARPNQQSRGGITNGPQEGSFPFAGPAGQDRRIAARAWVQEWKHVGAPVKWTVDREPGEVKSVRRPSLEAAPGCSGRRGSWAAGASTRGPVYEKGQTH